jgi:hypothetical protein
MTYSLSNLDPDMLEEIRDNIRSDAGKSRFLRRLQVLLSGQTATAADKDLAFSLAAELAAAGVLSLVSTRELAAVLHNQFWPKVASFLDGLPKSLRLELKSEISETGKIKKPQRQLQSKSLASTRSNKKRWSILDISDASQNLDDSETMGSSIDIDTSEIGFVTVKKFRGPLIAKFRHPTGKIVVSATKTSAKAAATAGSQLSAKRHSGPKKTTENKGRTSRIPRKSSSP